MIKYNICKSTNMKELFSGITLWKALLTSPRLCKKPFLSAGEWLLANDSKCFSFIFMMETSILQIFAIKSRVWIGHSIKLYCNVHKVRYELNNLTFLKTSVNNCNLTIQSLTSLRLLLSVSLQENIQSSVNVFLCSNY